MLDRLESLAWRDDASTFVSLELRRIYFSQSVTYTFRWLLSFPSIDVNSLESANEPAKLLDHYLGVSRTLDVSYLIDCLLIDLAFAFVNV